MQSRDDISAGMLSGRNPPNKIPQGEDVSNYRRARIAGGTFFFTVVTYGRFPRLASDSAVSLLRRSFEAVMARHPFTIDAMVILPDHLHCIWTLPEADSDFSTRWRLVKAGFSRAYAGSTIEPVSLSRLKKSETDLWQRRFWEHSLRDEKDFETHCDYIHYNPVKHGLVRSPADWKHSTFREFVARGVYPADWARDVVPESATLALE